MVPGLSDYEVIREWEEEGFGILPKPFRADDLRAKAREMLGSAGPTQSGA
jgi:hypothetical protein